MTRLSTPQRAWRWFSFLGIIPLGMVVWFGGAYLSRHTGNEVWRTGSSLFGLLLMLMLFMLTKPMTLEVMDDPGWWKWLFGGLAVIGLAVWAGSWLFTSVL